MTKQHAADQVAAMQDEAQAPVDPRRAEIARYIEWQLGDLGPVYHDAIASSVDGGYYDAEWLSGVHTRIERYLGILYKDFMDKHQDKQYLLHRLLVKLEYGSDDEKQQLKQLLDIE